MAEDDRGETPLSTRCAPGWYARGAGTRPARIQLAATVRLQAVEISGDYNIWYGRYSGERGHARSAPAATRCHLDTDAGLTLADYTESKAPFCLHFARGACAYGKACNFRHRAPLDEDESTSETRVDIFGRERHASFRDDMGGVGSWARDHRTLYVGRVCVLATESEVHATVYNHFSEWGEIDYCRVLMNKGCAFVSYKLRCAAEFAKEAMADQSLDHDEQLNVRWACEDPNPRAKAERLRVSAQLMLEAMRARGHAPPSSAAEPYGREEADEEAEGVEPPGAKRRRGAGPAAPKTREEAEAEAAALAAAMEEEAEAEAALAAAQRELQVTSKLDSILGRIDAAAPYTGASVQPAQRAATPVSAAVQPTRAAAPIPDGAAAAALNAGSSFGLGAETDGSLDLPPGVAQPVTAGSAAVRSAAPAADPSCAAAVACEWVGRWDSASGHSYFVNTRTGESRWAWEWGWAQQPMPGAGEQWAAYQYHGSAGVEDGAQS